MKERRKSERIETHLPAQWETASGMRQGTIVNGSVGGCFVEAEVEDPGDEPIKLAIQLPHEGWIYLWGEVAFHLPTVGFGIHFTRSSNDGQVTLDKWLHYLRTL